MRVLLVHAYYKERGGEDAAYETDVRLLADAGHDVRTLTFSNAEIGDGGSLTSRLSLAVNTVWSRRSARRVEAAVVEHAPDVVHFHNTFPLISPAAFAAAGRFSASVVVTLHNYRFVCANANLYRDGSVCQECIGKAVPYPAVAHACYRGGRAESAVVASMQAVHRMRRTWTRDVDLFVTPSQFARTKLIEGGLPADRLVVRSNAVLPAPIAGDAPREGFFFAGRLAPNKGIHTLLDAWRAPDMPILRVAGDGELAGEVRAAVASGARIEYLGPLSQDDVVSAMRRSIAVVVPSAWYEIQGLVILEAFSCGTPVIASDIGAIPETVRDGESGILVPPGNATVLAERVRRAAKDAAAMRTMGDWARALFEDEFSPRRSIARLIDVYEHARALRRAGRAEAQLEPA